MDGEKIVGDSWEYPPLPRYEQTKEILWQMSSVLAAVEWPVSKELEDQGLVDAYRKLHPRVRSAEGRRIDRVYYKLCRWHPVKWPSDHPAVIVTFRQSGE